MVGRLRRPRFYNSKKERTAPKGESPERTVGALWHLTLRSKVLNARLRGEVRYKKRGEKNMASAKFQGGKYHNASEVKAHFRHDDISVQSRKIAARTNPNIDISKSIK